MFDVVVGSRWLLLVVNIIIVVVGGGGGLGCFCFCCHGVSSSSQKNECRRLLLLPREKIRTGRIELSVEDFAKGRDCNNWAMTTIQLK
jgi:hypothetical protein